MPKDISSFESIAHLSFFCKEYKKILHAYNDLETITDPEFREEVEKEKKVFETRLEEIYAQMESFVKKYTEDEEKEITKILLEVRAAAGGEEASLFARDLYEMYKKYALAKGWDWVDADISENNAGGYKEASARISAKECFELLQNEAGVHRVQRVPATEKAGRIHTSTASVVVLPLFEEKSLTIDPTDCTLEFSRSGGAGGQNVNKVESAVRIIHKPTGLEVRSTKASTQQRNREIALSILEAKVCDKENKSSARNISQQRKNQVGTGERSEKIRTYNIPQDRVTDHRIKKSWGNVSKIFMGDLDAIISAVVEEASSSSESEDK